MELLNCSVKRNVERITVRELREISTVPRSLTLPTFVSRSGKRDMKKVLFFIFYIFMYMSLVNQNKSSEVICTAESLELCRVRTCTCTVQYGVLHFRNKEDTRKRSLCLYFLYFLLFSFFFNFFFLTFQMSKIFLHFISYHTN